VGIRAYKYMTWDWKEYLDLDELSKVLHQLSEGGINLYQVETGSDQYAIVISRGELNEEQVAQINYDYWHKDE